MYSNKKGIESYIAILLTISVIMSALLFFILNIVYEKDNEKCEFVDFEVEDICKSNSKISFKVQNNAQSMFRFKFEDSESIELVQPLERKRFDIIHEGSFKIKPIVVVGINNFECNTNAWKVKDIEIRKC